MRPTINTLNAISALVEREKPRLILVKIADDRIYWRYVDEEKIYVEEIPE